MRKKPTENKQKKQLKQVRPLLPDLLALPPEDLQIEEREGHKLLLLSQGFANLGPGPLQIRRGYSSRACPGRRRAVGYQDVFFSDRSKKRIPLKECMVYHPVHRHWHVANIARYDLCKVDSETGDPGEVIASSDKISFCLIDEFRIDSDIYKGPRYARHYVSCRTRISGVSPGWIDEYDYKTYGQWIDITGIKDGVYFVRTTVNPKKLLKERTYRNNVAWRKVEIDGDDIDIVD